MTQIKFAPKAISDLDSIWEYTFKKWGLLQADNYVRAIHENCVAAAENYLVGSSVDFLRPNYFKKRSGHHIIFYRVSKLLIAIEIIRVLHEKMDLPSQLQGLGE